jgi:hypothetical protein
MIPIASEESAGLEGAGHDPVDPLRRVVHVALAIYLMPVVAIVCAIGGVAIVIDQATRLATRLAGEGHRSVKPGHPSVARSVKAGWRPAISRDRRRTRVGR